VPNTRVRVEGESAHTDANGGINIALSSKLREGARITIVVEKKKLGNQPAARWRVEPHSRQPARSSRRFVRIKSVMASGRIEKGTEAKAG
jgi:hypothetical protein